MKIFSASQNVDESVFLQIFQNILVDTNSNPPGIITHKESSLTIANKIFSEPREDFLEATSYVDIRVAFLYFCVA